MSKVKTIHFKTTHALDLDPSEREDIERIIKVAQRQRGYLHIEIRKAAVEK